MECGDPGGVAQEHKNTKGSRAPFLCFCALCSPLVAFTREPFQAHKLHAKLGEQILEEILFIVRQIAFSLLAKHTYIDRLFGGLEVDLSLPVPDARPFRGRRMLKTRFPSGTH